MDTIAQTYAQLLLDTDTFSHVEDGTPLPGWIVSLGNLRHQTPAVSL